jgi:hypothetical protein
VQPPGEDVVGLALVNVAFVDVVLMVVGVVGDLDEVDVVDEGVKLDVELCTSLPLPEQANFGGPLLRMISSVAHDYRG